MISIVCPSFRIEQRKRFVDQWSKTDVDYEILFIGPGKSEEDLGPHAREIEASGSVKPIQCWSWGFHVAQGELIGLAPDDLFIKPEDHALDTIHDEYKAEGTTNVSIGLSEGSPGREIQPSHYHIEPHNRESLPTAHVQFYPKYLFEQTGGPDKRFLGGQGDVDMWVRMAKYHGTYLKYSYIACSEETGPKMGGQRIRGTHDQDFALRNQLFAENQGYTIPESEIKNSIQRFDYTADDFLTINQGATGGMWVNPIEEDSGET